jgi:aminopeptidase
MSSILEKYANLLVNYCLEVKPGDRVLVKTTSLAEPLVVHLFRAILKAGGTMNTLWDFRGQRRIMMTEGNDFALNHLSPLYEQGLAEYECYLHIMAPHNLFEDQNIDPVKLAKRQKMFTPHLNNYFRRTATRDLRRNLCLFPTHAHAQFAEMSLEEYEQFVYGACNLYDDDPIASWKQVGINQQAVVDLLNQKEHIHYLGKNVDLQFRTKGRTWINSDGKTNMPSGEVYTSPEEDSVNGHIHFSYPGIYQGQSVEGVTLWVKDGYIEKWEASKGKDFLDTIFAMPGTRRFGEAAIGTNYNIQQITKNILFDEKIGGSVHMAIGQSYEQAGGKNTSAVHWDMITDMTQEGAIFADGEKIYENGRFLPEIVDNF